MNQILDSRISKDKLDQVGELLFGRALRLRLASWVLTREDPTFFQGEAAKGVDYTASSVIQELDRLVKLGMLFRQEKHPGDRRQYYSRAESPLWAVIREAMAALDGRSGRR